jgi:hypothetical protein
MWLQERMLSQPTSLTTQIQLTCFSQDFDGHSCNLHIVHSKPVPCMCCGILQGIGSDPDPKANMLPPP